MSKIDCTVCGQVCSPSNAKKVKLSAQTKLRLHQIIATVHDNCLDTKMKSIERVEYQSIESQDAYMLLEFIPSLSYKEFMKGESLVPCIFCHNEIKDNKNYSHRDFKTYAHNKCLQKNVDETSENEHWTVIKKGKTIQEGV